MVQLEVTKNVTPATSSRGGSFWWGLLALGLVTAIWGYSNVVIRELEFHLTPAAFLLIRYGLVGVLGLPWVFLGPRIPWRTWALGLGTGFFLSATTLFQALAMKSIPVDNVAFITALNVILTPLAMALWRRRHPHRMVMAAALTSLVGVALLVGHIGLSAAVGTLWALSSAVFATLQIIGTAEVSQRMTTLQLAVMEAFGAALALSLDLAASGQMNHALFVSLTEQMTPVAIWRLGYLAIIGTLVAGWLQVWGHRQLTATEAALIFNMEPVWTAVFS